MAILKWVHTCEKTDVAMFVQPLCVDPKTCVFDNMDPLIGNPQNEHKKTRYMQIGRVAEWPKTIQNKSSDS